MNIIDKIMPGRAAAKRAKIEAEYNAKVQAANDAAQALRDRIAAKKKAEANEKRRATAAAKKAAAAKAAPKTGKTPAKAPVKTTGTKRTDPAQAA